MYYRPLRVAVPAFSHFSFMVILSCSTLIHETAWADEPVRNSSAGKAGTDRHLTGHMEHEHEHEHEHESQAGMVAVSSEKIMVHHHRSGKVEAAWNNLKKIPGGTSIIDSKDTEKRSNATNADIFKFQPGLFAQAVCGGDDLRISVRGSGVQDGLSATRYGINFFFDGLPLTTTAGAVNELQEPLGVQYTEVLRGGNAIDMGGTLLGGAINYVSKTGYDADRYHARVEAGSFGYVKEQLSSGGVYGKADYYLSVTNAYRGGYQQNTKTSSFGVNFNFGYKFNDHVDTRLFVRYRQTDEGYPGYLTRSQIAQDPTQAQKGYGNTSTNGYGTHTLEPGSYFVGDKTNIHFNDGSKFTLGFDYQNTPMDHRLQFTRLQYGIQNASGMLDYTRSDTLFGRKSDTHVGVYTTAILSLWETQSVKDLVHYASYGAHVGQLISHDTFGGSTTTFHISNNYEIFHNFWLTTAGALTYAPRQIAVTYPTYSDLHTQSLYFQPRAGFRYVVNPHIQFYGNVTRGEEPQTIWRYLTGPLYTSGLATGQNAGGTNIKPSTSTTFEVGTEGNWRGTDWSLTYYHSAIRNELLSVMTPESQLYNEVLNANASPTTHQGVEFSTHSVLYQWSGGVVSLRQAYTYQDFRFNNDPTFGHNKLPGIPSHFYQGQLHLDLKNGFYIAADAQVSSSVEASYDNTYRAAPYHIYNFQMGYQWPGKHRMIYVDLHNLANKHYATAVIPSYQAAGKEVAAMLPGDGLGVFAGIDIGFN